MLFDAKSPLRLAVDGERLGATGRFSLRVLPKAVQAAGQHAAEL
jgi:diacylglycerol kinase family enzyme